MNSLSIPIEILRECEQHAELNLTEEICGLFEGQFNEDGSASVLAYHPIENIAPHKLALFVMDPTQQVKVFNDIFSRKNSVVGCFHSHPINLGIPSATDKSNISYEYYWVIYGGKDKLSRAWFPVLNPKNFLPSKITN